jgi:crotonobetaine/carnitine-CoA ligase
MPEKTLEAIRNCWFHTGDMGYMDENGWLYFVDRIKDAIRRKGENISSYEVEKVILQHPSVADCAAIAIKDPVMTEDEIKVCVVLKEGEKLTPEELINFCEPRMPSFHVPRYIEFLESFPKTPSQKVQKVKLREVAITQNTWDREKAGNG